MEKNKLASPVRLVIFISSMALARLAGAQAPAWVPAGPPFPRVDFTAVLDLKTTRMIVFGGGSTAGNLNDVWRLNRKLSWTFVSPTGTAPAPRTGPSAVYDHKSNRMIVFGGGLGNTSPCVSDVWVLTDANGTEGTPAWIQLSAAGGPPPSRLRHSAVYDPHSNRMIVFGGNDCFSTNFGDVWVLSNANGLGGTPTWAQLSPAGTPPGPSEDHTAVYDPGTNTMIVFGGTIGGSNSNAVWVLANANGIGGTATWTQLSPSGTLPPGRELHSAVYDAANNLMIIFGGGNSGGLLSDVWVLSNANGIGGTPSWTQLGPFPVSPGTREAHTAVYDPATNKMTIFGGFVSPTTVGGDVWVLDHANGLN